MHLTSFEKAVICTYIYRYFFHLLFHLAKLKSSINPKFQNYFDQLSFIHSFRSVILSRAPLCQALCHVKCQGTLQAVHGTSHETTGQSSGK